MSSKLLVICAALFSAAFGLGAEMLGQLAADGWIEGLLRLGVAGMVGGLLYFVLVKFVPGLQDRHDTERGRWADERREWLQILERLADAIERLERLGDQGE